MQNHELGSSLVWLQSTAATFSLRNALTDSAMGSCGCVANGCSFVRLMLVSRRVDPLIQ